MWPNPEPRRLPTQEHADFVSPHELERDIKGRGVALHDPADSPGANTKASRAKSCRNPTGRRCAANAPGNP
jgi:hypothetical protein